MRILQAIPGMGINSGGPTTCTYNLMKGLELLTDVDASLITFAPALGDRMIAKDSFIRVVPRPRETRFGYSLSFCQELKLMKSIDVYHANGLWQYPTHAVAVEARRRGKPYVVSPHGMLYPEALLVKPTLKQVMMALYQRKDLHGAACLHATCKAEAEHIRNLGFSNPIAVIPNGIPIEAVRPKNEDGVVRLGFVGRINRYKNIHLLLEAYRQILIQKREQPIELWIIGDGDQEYRQELVDFVEQHQLQGVRFRGFLQGEELTQAIANLSCLVLPSRSENFGMVVAEALLQLVPVIASKGTPWEELNRHRCGWWVDNRVESLVDTLNAFLLLSENERMEMGMRGRSLIENNYSLEAVALKMRDLYNWVVTNEDKPEFVDVFAHE